MAKSTKRLTSRKTGTNLKQLRIPAQKLPNEKFDVYLFHAKASLLYSILSINRKIEDKEEGYQRALSVSRVQAVARYVSKEKFLPGSIVISLDNSKFDAAKSQIIIPKGKDIGWVIDGQHRLAGANEASKNGVDIELSVLAFLDLDENAQIDQFVTINHEAKGVPTSLYLDLIRNRPKDKSPAELSKDRATDIALELRKDPDSPFFERIVITRPPKSGELSLVNFVRKISPHLLEGKGFLDIYTEKEQRHIISNYYKALFNVFSDEYKRTDSVFFRTIGFGALINALPTAFNTCLARYKGFTVENVTALFNQISHFSFSDWRELGTGSAAEAQAGEDLKVALNLAFRPQEGETSIPL